jgi:TonB family protein
MAQYIPGSGSPENLECARNAETEFNSVLQLDSKNLTALQSLASLNYLEAQGLHNEDQKFRKLDEAGSWYQRVLAIDSRDREAYYSLGVINWTKWYPNWMRARAQLLMRPEQPGPITNSAVRQDLLARYSSLIADGISNLEKALEIDPQYDDAMAYVNLFIRERADLRDTPEEFKRDVELADHWIEKALAAKRSKGSARLVVYPAGTSSPPPESVPQRIRVGARVMQANLIRQVEPIYPEARIEGTVRFTAIIGKDGGVMDLTLISGQPILLNSAMQAVKQWEYKPTLLNGQPVEVLTQIDVNFTLKQ